MPQLDNYLVTLGLKGQNAVLSTMDKIRKKGTDLTKKKTVTISAKVKPAKFTKMTPQEIAQGAAPRGRAGAVLPAVRGAGVSVPGRAGAAPSGAAPSGTPGAADQARAAAPKPPTPKPSAGENKFVGAVKKFGQYTDRVASGAATLSPTAFVQSIAATLPYVGAIASAAAGALESAKTSIAGAHGLATRNAATRFYGGDLVAGRQSQNTARNKSGFWSNSEHAAFVAAVSGSMGKIQQPLANEINNLVGKKDTRALSRAAAGDWESTGTDKGWIASQIAGSMGSLPPSIKQKMSASLLKNFGGEIQDLEKGQKGRQSSAAYYENAEENQTIRLANTAGKTAASLAQLNTAVNDLQKAMVTGAGQMVKGISFLVDQIKESKDKKGGTLNKIINLVR